MSKEQKSSLPKGFRSLVAARPDGYVTAKEGGTVQGVLLGRYPKKRGGYYYQIRLTAPCETCQVPSENGEDWQDGMLPIGAVVGLDERAAVRVLADHVGEDCEVFVKFAQKEELKDGSTFWRCEVAISDAGTPF